MKTLVIIGMIFGSLLGGYAPVLWGGSIFSMSSILLTAVGGFAGIWAGYKIASKLDI